MKIGAYCKCSMVDDGNNLSAVVFTAGCNMTCAYCHNLDLGHETPVNEAAILTHLKTRQGKLDSVVVSGGEPTLQGDLPDFLVRLKAMNYRVKLDTNGTNPRMLAQILKNNLVDYVAMDIKGTADTYTAMCGMPYDSVLESIALLRRFGQYEFRTTLYPALPIEAIEALCQTYKNDPYYLQQYRPTGHHDLTPYDRHTIISLADAYGHMVRGL